MTLVQTMLPVNCWTPTGVLPSLVQQLLIATPWSSLRKKGKCTLLNAFSAGSIWYPPLSSTFSKQMCIYLGYSWLSHYSLVLVSQSLDSTYCLERALKSTLIVYWRLHVSLNRHCFLIGLKEFRSSSLGCIRYSYLLGMEEIWVTIVWSMVLSKNLS